MRMKWLGTCAPAIAVAAALATIGLAGPASAATGSKPYSAGFTLSCVLGPGTLNVAGTVSAALSATGPETVSPGDSVSLTGGTSTITTPPAWSSAFSALGAKTASGTITSLYGAATGVSQTAPIDIAQLPPYGSAGLPWGPEPVVAGQSLTFSAPNSGTLTIGPYTVTGAPGTDITVSTAGGSGSVQANATGYDSGGNVVAGPVPVTCDPPSPPALLGQAPIVAATTSTSTSTASTTATASSTSTTTISTTATTSTPPAHLLIHFNNWTLGGSLTDRALGQTIDIPAGSTFNGVADLTAQTLTGDVAVPPFTATVKLLGLLPTQVGLRMTEAGPATGTVAPDPTTPGNLAIDATATANITITSVGAFGLNIPTTCTTSGPVVFPLKASLPSLQLTQGATFTGTTTLPPVRCGGLLGFLLSPLMTALFSGPNNPFSLSIAPPAQTTTTTTTTSSSGGGGNPSSGQHHHHSWWSWWL